jgi:glycerophosphoryl diester phosphodiesterase
VTALDAGAWKHRRWAGERVPLLRGVLATVPPLGHLFIELKEGPETVPPTVAAVRAAWLSAQQVILMSFLATTVAAAVRALPETEVLLLVRSRDYVSRGGWSRVVARAQALRARGLGVEAHRTLDAARIAAAHDAGLAVYVWTVNRPATARRLATAGIDGITTDRCAWMHSALGG